MGLALLLMTFGGMLMYSSLKDQGILDVFAGKEADAITPKDYSSYSDAAIAGEVAGPPIPGKDSQPAGPAGPGGLVTQTGTVNFDGRAVAAWIVPILKWARSHGWTGTVSSGWRDPNRVVTPSPGLPVAPQGKSNHNGTAYPRGAVDVTNPEQLAAVLRNYPNKPNLVWGGPVINDRIHFSANGH